MQILRTSRVTAILVAAALFAPILPATIPVGPDAVGDDQASDLLVGFHDGAPAHLEALVTAFDAELIETYPLLNAALVRTAYPSTFTERFAQLPTVAYVEPDHILEAQLDPIDALFANGQQKPWLNPQGIREGWNLTLGDHRTVIAIIDSGMDLDHPDLVDRVWENPLGDLTDLANFTGPDYVDVPDTDGPEDTFGHGTHVAGIAAATFDNATGLAGVAAT